MIEISQSQETQTDMPKKRGRKLIILPRPIIGGENKIVLQQYHFKYSDEFADKLAKFAMKHLEDTSKEFKHAWDQWTIENSDIISNEIERIEKEGYKGSVQEKMYFSARYYYRKKAIKEQDNTQASQDEKKEERKKNEPMDKESLKKMNEHILLKIKLSKEQREADEKGNIVLAFTPTELFAEYCSKYEVRPEDVESSKKKYKNLYWRISKKLKEQESK